MSHLRLEKYTILQILPAEGWYAKYKQDDETSEYVKIMFFALVEFLHEGQKIKTVEPMDYDPCEGSDLCINISNFQGIEYLPQISD